MTSNHGVKRSHWRTRRCKELLYKISLVVVVLHPIQTNRSPHTSAVLRSVDFTSHSTPQGWHTAVRLTKFQYCQGPSCSINQNWGRLSQLFEDLRSNPEPALQFGVSPRCFWDTQETNPTYMGKPTQVPSSDVRTTFDCRGGNRELLLQFPSMAGMGRLVPCGVPFYAFVNCNIITSIYGIIVDIGMIWRLFEGESESM